MLAVAIAAVVLALVLAGVQLAVTRIAAERIRRRLTAAGGTAEVEVASFPATRLLRERGDRLVVRGRGLTIAMAGEEELERAGLRPLDGFDTVDIELQDVRTGPFALRAFVLSREGPTTYAMATQGTVTAAELVRLGGIPGAGVVGTLVEGLPIVSREIAVSVQIELFSEPGGLRVGTGGGSVAGYPAGPVATLIAAAVARRLDLTP